MKPSESSGSLNLLVLTGTIHFQIKPAVRRVQDLDWLSGSGSKLLTRRKSIDPAKIRDMLDQEPGNETSNASSAAPNLVRPGSDPIKVNFSVINSTLEF